MTIRVRPPKSAQAFARKGLAARQEAMRSRRCCTRAGMTRAHSILRDELQDAVDIRGWFRRHHGNYEKAAARAVAEGLTLRQAAPDEPAIQAWWIWGGQPMWDASERAVETQRVRNPEGSDLSETWRDVFSDLDLDWEDEWDAEEKAAPEFSRRTGLPLLGAGNTRVVFGIGRDAIKLPYTSDGPRANRRECAIWEKATPEQRQLLAPIVACDPDGRWLVMARAEPVTAQELPALDWGSPVEQTLGALGVTDIAHRAQWGRLPDGRVVVIDYAGR